MKRADPLQEELPLFASVAAHAVFPGRSVLRCHEVARVMNCTARHIADLCAEGKIAATNIGGDHSREVKHWRIPVSAYDGWIKANSSLALARQANFM